MNNWLGYSLAVSLGGAIGAALRYWVSLLLAPWSVNWPWATFSVNALGSMLMGAGLVYFSQGTLYSNWLKLLLLTGCLGSFTTFSTFSIEALSLFKGEQWAMGMGYLAASVLICLLAASIGGFFVHRLLVN